MDLAKEGVFIAQALGPQGRKLLQVTELSGCRPPAGPAPALCRLLSHHRVSVTTHRLPLWSLTPLSPWALRDQFVWEQRWERANQQAAETTSDACLKELYQELAQDGVLHAATIRSLLEQMG